MNAAQSFSLAEIEALESFREVIAPDRWALIGASAIRCRLPLPRPTLDIDFVVAAPEEAVRLRLSAGGWRRDPRRLQSWRRGIARVDVVFATDDDIAAGVVVLEGEFSLTVAGLDLAFLHTEQIPIRNDLTVPVARLPVIALLKMVAWLERPERQKDLHDLVFMMDNLLANDDDARWDPTGPLADASIEHDCQSPFQLGWELGRIAEPAHLRWANRFIEVMRDEEAPSFAQLLRAADYAGDNVEDRLRSRLVAFERGLETGASKT